MSAKRMVGLMLVLALVVVSAAGCSGDKKAAASKGTALVRVASLFFPMANVTIDGKTVLDHQLFPYISDDLTLSAGKHTLSVASTDGQNGPAASTDLKLEDGHHYLVVSYGNIVLKSDHVLKVIDETENFNQIGKDHNVILFLHLIISGPALDGYLKDQKVVDNLGYGQSSVYNLPIGESPFKITLAGQPNLVLDERDAYGLPNNYAVVALVGTFLNPTVAISARSPLNVLDFFTQAAQAGGYFDTLKEMLDKSDLAQTLSGPGPITVFAPWDSSFMDAPSATLDAIKADPAKLNQVMRYYVVPEYLPPSVLYQRATLTTLQGSPLTVTTSATAPRFTLNGSVPLYQDYRLSNGVMYEAGSVMLPPSIQ